MMTLIQMHGYPGSGKSTVARAVGCALPAIVIDKDVIAAAFLRTGVPSASATAASYEAMRGLASRLLEDGHSVILDSPCFWPVIEEATRTLATRHNATWVMLQCICPVDVVDRRLAERARLESQPAQRLLGPLAAGSYFPECRRMALDTTRTVEENVAIAIAYIRKECGA